MTTIQRSTPRRPRARRDIFLLALLLVACSEFNGVNLPDPGPGEPGPGEPGPDPGPVPVPSRLAFQVHPTAVQAGVVISPAVEVSVLDDTGSLATDFAGDVTVRLDANPGGASLSGATTVDAVDGVAVFADLRLDAAASGYRLAAEADGLTGVTSQAFNVFTPGGGDAAPVALTDMGARTYFGFAGGLYPGGNEPPTAHRNAGLDFAAEVQRRDTNGNPSASGRYVLISIGMSNTAQEFCAAQGPCNGWTFAGQAAADPGVGQGLTLINGALSSQTAPDWERPQQPNYDRILTDLLTPAGLSEDQVQAAWLKVANSQPSVSLPDPNADVYQLAESIGNIVRTLKVRYPNIKQVFISSRIYGGYATTGTNPEPYAYETGLAVKWVIEAQIEQMAGGGVDPLVGDLNYDTVAPWLGWAAYMWADGENARSDGLTWVRGDFVNDGTHPSTAGETKVGAMLLDFFGTSPFTTPWFVQ